MILNNSSGFIYYVSIMGITGTKKPSLLKVKKSVNGNKKKYKPTCVSRLWY